MAEENRPPGSQGPRRRPPPVIDLEAKEVPSETPPKAETAAGDQPADQAAPETPASEPPPPEPEPQPAAERRPPFAFEPARPSWRHAGTAAAAAGGGLLVALLFWLGGAFSGGHEAAPDLNPRLASIEKQLKDLAARPMPASVDPKETKAALDDIAARLSKLEAAAATPRPPVTDPVVLGRLTAGENAAKSLADNVAALSRRAEATDAAIRDTDAKIGKLAATVDDVRNTVRQAAAGSDRASRFAVAASALRGAVERGDPFTAELAIVKPLASDANAVAQLEPFAAAGVPGNAALGRELATLVRPMLRASDEAPTTGGFLDKLQANAEKLVRIRPVGEEARGDDRNAILSRIEQRASQGNVAGALTEIDKLPADARAPLQAWIAKAGARDKAVEASHKLSADAVVALKASP